MSGIAKVPRLFGRDVLARYQNGLIQFYAGASALAWPSCCWSFASEVISP